MSEAGKAAIKAFDMSDATEQLKAKLKLAFVELIPPEQWEALVKEEFQKFVDGWTERDRWRNEKVHPSGFHEAAQEVLHKICREKIREAMKDEEWLKENLKASSIAEYVEKYLDANQEEFVKAAISQLIGDAVRSTLYEIQRMNDPNNTQGRY